MSSLYCYGVTLGTLGENSLILNIRFVLIKHEKRTRHCAEVKGWDVMEVYHPEAVSGK